jgi:ubiquinone/menaquinone biosynthesis C-methylase UbiE
MADFHFVEDYEAHVRQLMATHPLREAMDLAVGGAWEAIQQVELAILRHFGLRDGMALVDLGCGSGRLAQALGRSELRIEYLGLDVVQALLDYARTITPRHYRFLLNRALTLPLANTSIDMLCAFSVFTHLFPEETYLYLQDARRALRPHGKVVLSFLEFREPSHWTLFESTAETRRRSTRLPLTMFLTREAINIFAQRLGYEEASFVGGREAPWGGAALGQSVALLRR